MLQIFKRMGLSEMPLLPPAMFSVSRRISCLISSKLWNILPAGPGRVVSWVANWWCCQSKTFNPLPAYLGHAGTRQRVPCF